LLQYSLFSARMGDPPINFSDANAGFCFGIYHFDSAEFRPLDPTIGFFELTNSRVNLITLETKVLENLAFESITQERYPDFFNDGSILNGDFEKDGIMVPSNPEKILF
jgi:hypothetical protein